MTDLRIAAGDILARKYRVERVLGQGGMGVVVAAMHVDLGQPVALKLMLPDKEQTPEMRERFLREARAAVRLKSQHVAKVLDVGTDEHNMPYIAMEFLEGNDLAATLKQRGPLPFEDAVEYVLQACEAVGEAHAAGIVHRDLKPANMFLTRDVSGAPCIKVLDFGISKVLGADLTLTHETQTLGSPLFMSPEAMGSAKNVDARTDIWALGIILYQLVAQKTPFHEPTMAQLCTRILTGAPTPLAEYRSDAPSGFESVIHQCLQRDREQRFPNVAALAHALAPFAPQRAHVYVERIARIMGVDLNSLGPVSMASAMPISTPGRTPFASVPGVGVTSQAAVVMSAASAPLTPDVPAKPQSRLPLVVGAALAVLVPGAFLIFRSMNGTPESAAPGPSASTSSIVEATVEPVPKTSGLATTNQASPTAAPSASVAESIASAPVKAPAATVAPPPKSAATPRPAVKPIPTSKALDYDERR